MDMSFLDGIEPQGESAPESQASASQDTQDSALENSEIKVEEVAQPEASEVKTPEAPDIVEQIRQASQEQPDDSSTIRSLRQLLKHKIEPGIPVIDDSQKENLELVNQLFQFDVERGVPTAKGFAESLAAKDFSVAVQVFADVGQIPVPNSEIQGWTIGHEFLQSIGLDPMKLPELQRYSRGEIEIAGRFDVPDFIPEDYVDAYKALDSILRTDVDIYLSSEDSARKAAGLRLLQDKNQLIVNDKAYRENEARNAQSLENQVQAEIDSQLTSAYSQLLDTIKQNPAYVSVKISSNQMVDSVLKDSLISQINALGDENSVLRNRAVQQFKSIGVEIDTKQVEGLLSEIETQTKIAVKAQKMGEAQKTSPLKQNVDYARYASEALDRRSKAIAKALALGNRYFSEALSKMSSVPLPSEGNSEKRMPIINGSSQSESRAPGVMSPKDLDSMILGISQNIKQSSST